MKKVQQKVHGKVPVIKIKSLNLFVSMPRDRRVDSVAVNIKSLSDQAPSSGG